MFKNIFLSFLPAPVFLAGSEVSNRIATPAMKSKGRKVQHASVIFAWCSAIFLVLACRQASAAITRDVAISLDQNTAASSVTSPAFTTKSGQELLLAFVSADELTTPNTTVQSVTGAGLTWVMVVRTNTQSGTSEIWRAFAPSVLTNVTVSAKLSQSVVSSITVESFSGVNVSGTNGSGAIGAVGSGHAASGAPSATLVTTQSNSVVVGVGNDFDTATARTPLAGQTLVHQAFSSTGDTYWVQQVTAQTATSGTRITLGDSAPTSDQYNLSICEIVPPSVASGSAAAAQLTLSATTLSYGNVNNGSSATQSVILKSSGTAPVTISSISASGTGFSIPSATLPATLAVGQTLTIPATFAPTTAGATSGALKIVSNSTAGATSTVTLTGTGVAVTSLLTMSTSALSYGSIADGTSKTLSLTLTSSGRTAVSISSLSVSGTGFSVPSMTMPKALASGKSMTIPVTFAPTTAGAVSGTLKIVSNSATGATSTVTLSGTGTSSTPQLTLSASSLSYGSIVDGTSKALSVTLTSSGRAAVTVSSLSISGTGFSIPATTLPATLAAGQTLTIPVTFAPKTAGAVSGSLKVVSNSTTGATSTVTLSGTGTASTPQLTLSASSLSYGSIADGTSKALSVTLTSSGTAAVTINSLSLSGTGFSMMASSMPLSLAVGQSLTVQITFAPTTAGAASGTLTINSTSATGATSTVSLSGTGTTAPSPKLTLSATSLSFGTVTEGSPTTESVTLSSTGTTALTVSSASITGTGFSIVGGSFPITLNAGATATLTVQFAPTAATTVTGQLTINSNSTTGATSTVALSGTGEAAVAHSVDLTWTAPSSSTDPVAGYHVYRMISGGTTYTLLNSSIVTQTSYVDSNVVSGTTYEYEVKSVDSAGVESAASNQFTATIP